MKHTLGEWKARRTDFNRWRIESHRLGFAPVSVAVVTMTLLEVGVGNAEQHEANARLMAAAPDLLAACETAVTLFEMDNETNEPGTSAWAWLQVARDAITKARGGE